MIFPLQYFGYRDEQVDIFKLITANIQQRGKKYRCCFDLFSGSGSITFAALVLDVAERYVINDIYAPLIQFWFQVKNNPEKLINEYQQLVLNFYAHDTGEQFYQDLQKAFNLDSKDSPEKAAACFAFIINHAKQGLPLLLTQADKLILACEYDKETVLKGQFPIDSAFNKAVMDIHQLFKGKQIEFHNRDFKEFMNNKEIASDDLVFLDPPYPDLEDAEETQIHVYQRSEPKKILQENLISCIKNLDAQKTNFVLFYGVLGLENICPIKWPQGHVIRLSGSKQGLFNEYIEHAYLSTELAQVLVSDSSYQGKLQPCFHRVFETQAVHNANRNALIWNGDSITYQKLNERANYLARLLLSKGLETALLKEETLVTIYLDRGPQLIISLLAVLKSGAAFLPMDTYLDRLSLEAACERLTLSGARFLITHPHLYQKIKAELNIQEQHFTVIQISQDDIWYENGEKVVEIESEVGTNLSRNINPDSLAYVMYTSGSSGEPKGVEILHRGLPYAYESHQDLLHLNRYDHVAQFGSIGFDASLMEIMMALGSGAELHLVNEEEYQDISKLKKLYQNNDITVTIQTPHFLAQLNPNDFPKLRCLLIVGESFGKELVNKWLPLPNNNNRQVINGYGLTETTIVATLEECNEKDELTIGKPILGLHAYLKTLDSLDQEELDLNNINTKDNDNRQLFFSGPCIARGYWKNPNITKERFLELQGTSTIKYNTGDIVKQLTNGKLVYVGRVDRQIKLRGQRLELSELENQIKSRSDFVEDVRVVVHADGKTKRLAAYIVPKNKQLITSHGDYVSKECLTYLRALRQYLIAKMPGFMCPAISNMLLVDALPRKKNDKKSYDDKKMITCWPVPCIILPLSFSSLHLTNDADKKLMKAIRAICLESLELPLNCAKMFSYEHDFYDYSGDSLKVNHFISALKLKAADLGNSKFKHICNYLSVLDFNRDPTLKGLWEWYQNQLKKEEADSKQFIAFIKNKEISLTRKMLALELTTLDSKSDMLVKKSQRLPFYCIHSLLGDAELDYAHTILNKLPCEYHVLSTPDFILHDEGNHLFEQLMEHYLQKIQSDHPHGPYWLLGWSSGGLLALELAKRLRMQGESVYTFMLDAHHPSLIQKIDSHQHVTHLIVLANKIYDRLKQILPFDSNFTFDKSEDELKKIPNKKGQITRLASILLGELRKLQNKLGQTISAIRWERAKKIIMSMHKLYEMELELTKFPTKIDDKDFLIVTRDSKRLWQSLYLGWEKPLDRCLLEMSDCDHFTLLQSVKVLEEINKKLLQQLHDIKTAFYSGVECYLKGDFQHALTHYKKSIEMNPKNFWAFYNKGMTELQLGELKHALSSLTEAIDLDHKSNCVYQLRGGIKLQLEDFDGAMKDFDQIIMWYPNNANNFSNRAQVKYTLNQFAEAVQDCNHALQIDPNHVQALMTGANAKAQLNLIEQSIEDYTKVIHLEPNKEIAFLNRSVAYARQKLYQKQIDDLTQVLRINSKNVSALMTRALVKEHLNLVEQSIEDYSEVIRLDPNNELAFIRRSDLYAKQNLYKKQISDLTQALRINPENGLTYLRRGHARESNQNAIADFDMAIKKGLDKEAIVFFLRGITKGSLGDYVGAINDLDQAIQLDPNDAKAYCNRGTAKFRRNDITYAILDFTKAIELDPKNSLAYRNRGNARAFQGKHAAAIKDYVKATQLNQDHEEGVVILSACASSRIMLQDYEGAIRDYTYALQLDGANPEIYYHRARTYAIVQDYKNVLNDFSQVVLLNPNFFETSQELVDFKRLVTTLKKASVRYYPSGNLAQSDQKNETQHQMK